MIEVGSYWKREIHSMLGIERADVIKIVDIQSNDVIVCDAKEEHLGTSMERYMLLKYYTKLTPLEVELL